MTDYKRFPLDSKGTHVRAVKLVSEDPNYTGLQVTVWPLPTDEALHQELAIATRDAVNAVLVKHKIAAGTWTDIHVKGEPH